jgi:hypothetical protein
MATGMTGNSIGGAYSPIAAFTGTVFSTGPAGAGATSAGAGAGAATLPGLMGVGCEVPAGVIAEAGVPSPVAAVPELGAPSWLDPDSVVIPPLVADEVLSVAWESAPVASMTTSAR